MYRFMVQGCEFLNAVVSFGPCMGIMGVFGDHVGVRFKAWPLTRRTFCRDSAEIPLNEPNEPRDY